LFCSFCFSVSAGVTYKAPGDFDGDHKLDIAFYNLNNFSWKVYNQDRNLLMTINWGAGGDIPIPFALTRKSYE